VPPRWRCFVAGGFDGANVKPRASALRNRL
jgi:hypothetical protein